MKKKLWAVPADVAFIQLLVMTIILGYLIGFIYTIPRNIHHEFSAIKYKAGSPEFLEPVSIDIYGSFKRKLWGFNETDQFEGDFMINGEKSYIYIVPDSIQTDDFKGALHIGSKMKEITILIYEDMGFNLKSGGLSRGHLITEPKLLK